MSHPPMTLIWTGFKICNNNEKINTPCIIDHKRKFGDMWTLHVTFTATGSTNYIPHDYMEEHTRTTINLRKLDTF